MGRSFLALGGGALAAGVLIAASALYWIEKPVTLTVAVSEADADDRALLGAAAKLLKAGRHASRLKTVLVADAVAASAAVDDGQADLAVIRTDVAVPARGETVVVLHRDAAVFVAPASTELRAVSDLSGHRLGLVRNGSNDDRLLATVLAQVDVAPASVAVETLSPDDVADAVRAKRVDAVLVVGVVSSPFMRDVVRAVRDGGDGPPVFIPVSEAEAIAQRSPAYDSTEVVKGTFGGATPRPADDLDTLSVTYRLVAEKSLDLGAVAELTRLFLNERLALVASAPLARRIEAPSTDKGAALPVHAGAAAFIDDDEQTFFDKYSDIIYIGAMALGVVASGATAIVGRMNGRKAVRLDTYVARLLDMLGLVRASSSTATLDDLQGEADAILGAALGHAALALDERRMASFSLALDQVRSAIRDRRDDLAGMPVPANDGATHRIAVGT